MTEGSQPTNENWSLSALVSLFGSHCTAFYALWSYLWLVIAASLTASISIDPNKVTYCTRFRYFLAFTFLGHAAVNLYLLLDTRKKMDHVPSAIEVEVQADASAMLSVPPCFGVSATQVVLTAFTLLGHAVLIGLVHLGTN